jgi:hypothetical protein
MSGAARADVKPDGVGVSAGLALRITAAWALVGIPLAWGVWQVFRKSLDLFR